MSTKDYSKIEVRDDRTAEERAIYTHLIIGVDNFLSGWGMAKGGKSIAAWACTPDLADIVKKNIKNRGDIENVIEQVEPLTVAAMCRNMRDVKHISIYKVTESHKYAKEQE